MRPRVDTTWKPSATTSQTPKLVVYGHADVKSGEDFQCGASLSERPQRVMARGTQTQTEGSDSPSKDAIDVVIEADYDNMQVFGGSAEANGEGVVLRPLREQWRAR